MEPDQTLTDDELPIADELVGDWSIEKHGLVQQYASLFIRAMKGKGWYQRVYLDLFSGSGRCQIKETNRIHPAPPLLVLGLVDSFDQYIFNDVSKRYIVALEERVKNDFPGRHSQCSFSTSDANLNTTEIVAGIPDKSLTFCFLDPFSTTAFKFSTIQTLAERRMDFLVLLPTDMDVHRNESIYTQEDNQRIDECLGSTDWRQEWERRRTSEKSNFGDFFIEQFAISVRNIKGRSYIIDPTRFLPIKNNRNVRIYQLAFFSESDLASKFFDVAKDYRFRFKQGQLF